MRWCLLRPLRWRFLRRVRVLALFAHPQRGARSEPHAVVFLPRLQHRAACDEVVGHIVRLDALVALSAAACFVGSALLWGPEGLRDSVLRRCQLHLLVLFLLHIHPACADPGGKARACCVQFWCVIKKQEVSGGPGFLSCLVGSDLFLTLSTHQSTGKKQTSVFLSPPNRKQQQETTVINNRHTKEGKARLVRISQDTPSI